MGGVALKLGLVLFGVSALWKLMRKDFRSRLDDPDIRAELARRSAHKLYHYLSEGCYLCSLFEELYHVLYDLCPSSVLLYISISICINIRMSPLAPCKAATVCAPLAQAWAVIPGPSGLREC